MPDEPQNTSDQKPDDTGPRTQAPGVVPTIPTKDEGGEAIAAQNPAATEDPATTVEPEPEEDPEPAPKAVPRRRE